MDINTLGILMNDHARRLKFEFSNVKCIREFKYKTAGVIIH